jgi:2-keto-4-pentenoate hydratase
MRRFARIAYMLALAPLAAAAACPDDAAIAAYVAEFRAGTPSKGFGKEIDADSAACARNKLTQALPQVLGPVVGYKAVFTNPDSQRRFGVAGPAWGVMFGRMMLADGARLPANFGALSRYESDFVVVVGDAALAEATTPREALAHISELVPFIELPDIMVAGKPTGPEIIATNAAFRGGVLGAHIAVRPDNAAALAEALANMDVVVTEDRSGREIGREKGSVLMGNPLNAAIWLAQALKKDGIALKPGDLLSLGGFLASAPTRAGTSMTVHYNGLPGNPAVTVHFD